MGEKLEAERQGAERQDEERTTGTERPEVEAARRTWRIRLRRSNLPLLHARRLALLAYRTGSGLPPAYRPVVACRLHTESVPILFWMILEILDLCRSIQLPS